MPELFNRQIIFRYGQPDSEGRQWAGLRMDFDVKRSLSGKPNPGKLKVYNLPESALAEVTNDGIVFQLLAGYSVPSLLIQGEAVRDNGVNVNRRPPESILELQIGDGLRSYESERINLSYDGSIKASEVLRDLRNKTNIGDGLTRLDSDFEFTSGLKLQGSVRDILRRLGSSLRADISTQNGKLEILGKGQFTDEVVILSPQNGTLLEVKRTREGVQGKTFLNGAIRPGARVDIRDTRDNQPTGTFKIRDVRHAGSEWSETFYTTFTGRAQEPPPAEPEFDPDAIADRLGNASRRL